MPDPNFSYRGGPVDQSKLEQALDFLVAIEPEPGEFSDYCDARGLDEGDAYEEIITKNAASIDAAHAAIRAFGEQIKPANADAMRQKFNAVVRKPKYQDDPLARSVSYSAFNRGWSGLNGWKA